MYSIKALAAGLLLTSGAFAENVFKDSYAATLTEAGWIGMTGNTNLAQDVRALGRWYCSSSSWFSTGSSINLIATTTNSFSIAQFVEIPPAALARDISVVIDFGHISGRVITYLRDANTFASNNISPNAVPTAWGTGHVWTNTSTGSLSTNLRYVVGSVTGVVSSYTYILLQITGVGTVTVDRVTGWYTPISGTWDATNAVYEGDYK